MDPHFAGLDLGYSDPHIYKSGIQLGRITSQLFCQGSNQLQTVEMERIQSQVGKESLQNPQSNSKRPVRSHILIDNYVAELSSPISVAVK